MVQILQKNPTWQEQLGAGLGSGLSSGLQQLASLKLNQMQQRQRAQQIGQAYKAAGLPENLAYLPDEAQKAIFKGLGERGGLDILLGLGGPQEPGQPQAQQQQQFLPQQQLQPQKQPTLQQILQGSSPTQLMDFINASRVAPEAYAQPQQQEPMDQQNGQQQRQFQQFQQLQQQQQAAQQQQFQPIQKQLGGAQSNQPFQNLQQQNVQQQPIAQQPQIAQPQKPRTLADVLRQPTQKQLAEQRKEQFTKQKEINKETKQFYSDTYRSSKAADENDKRLARMEELIKKGDLDTPGTASIANALKKGLFGFGIDLSGSLKPDTQEFIKLSNDFVKMAKDIYGSRISNYEVEQFLQTVPSVTQSNEAKLRLIRSLRNFNEGARARYKAMKDIIASNNGERPANLELLVDEIAAPELNFLAAEFKNNSDITKPYLQSL